MEEVPPDLNRVVIDECVYEVKPAGTLRYALFDEFGAALGYFMLRGKTVVPDDYGVAPHPVARIGKVWLAQNGGSAPEEDKPCFMVARTETVAQGAPLLKRAKARVGWLKVAGLAKVAYAVHDASSGKLSVVSVFTSQKKLDASNALAPPADAGPLEGCETEVLSLLADL